MTHYTLDVAKWRCGGARLIDEIDTNALGFGLTRMLNDKGYKCCLGQFAEQKGVNLAELLDASTPSDYSSRTKVLYDENFVRRSEATEFKNTELAYALIDINDNNFTSVKYKLKEIQSLLVCHGHTLTIINGEQYDV